MCVCSSGREGCVCVCARARSSWEKLRFRTLNRKHRLRGEGGGKGFMYIETPTHQAWGRWVGPL